MKWFILFFTFVITSSIFATNLRIVNAYLKPDLNDVRKNEVFIEIVSYGIPVPIIETQVKWTITDPHNIDAKLNNSASFRDDLERHQGKKVNIGIAVLDTHKEHLLIVELEEKKYYQHIYGKYTNAGVFIIDKPSPKEPASSELLLSIINYGPNKMHCGYVGYIWQDKAQSDLFDKHDTTLSQLVKKLEHVVWEYQVFVPPLDSGEIRQIKVNNFTKGTNDILIAFTSKPNGNIDFAADDTSRIWLGPDLLGKYSLSNQKEEGNFESLEDAVNQLYSRGIHDIEYDTIWGMQGVQILAREGINKPVYFNYSFENLNAKNPFTLATFKRDSTKYKIISEDKDYVLKFNDFHHFSVSGFSLINNSSGHVIVFEENVNNFNINGCSIQGADIYDITPDNALIINRAYIDSGNISKSFLLNGSYGIYYTGMNQALKVVGSTYNIFSNQKNCAISLSNIDNPFVTANYIKNNRLEILNSRSIFIGHNFLVSSVNYPDKKGRTYNTEPMSLISVKDCSGETSVINNNVCAHGDNTYEALYLNNCTGGPSFIGHSSLQSNNNALHLEGVENINIVQSSLETKNADKVKAPLKATSTTKWNIYGNIFYNSSGGYVMISSKPDTAVRNNFYNSGHKPLAQIDNEDINDILALKSKLNSKILTISENPKFIECDLTAQSQNVNQIGYHPNTSKKNPPKAIFPDGVFTPTNLRIRWEENKDTNPNYWLQVSKNNFDSEDYVLDQPNIENPYHDLNNLEYETEYQWRVKIFDSTARSEWSQIYKFNTEKYQKVEDEKKRQPLFTISGNCIVNPEDKIYLIQTQSFYPSCNIGVYDILGNQIFKTKKNMINQYEDITEVFRNLNNAIYLVVIEAGEYKHNFSLLLAK